VYYNKYLSEIVQAIEVSVPDASNPTATPKLCDLSKMEVFIRMNGFSSIINDFMDK